jgi:hypothetical protein
MPYSYQPRRDFIKRGQKLPGFPIDVIAVREEAWRLIRVSHLLSQSDERRLQDRYIGDA